MKHEEYVALLNGPIGERIISQLCMCSPTIRRKYEDVCVKYWCLKEFIVRFDKGLILPGGRYERCNRRFDAIIFVVPTLNALAQKWDFKVGFEIKTCSKDLIDDDKIPYYLGWTDFFFLGVKDDLIEVALKKAEGDPRLGVVSLTSGEIHKMPAWQDVPMGRKYELMEQAFYRYAGDEQMRMIKIDGLFRYKQGIYKF